MSRQMSLPFLAALAAAALTPRHSGAIAQRHGSPTREAPLHRGAFVPEFDNDSILLKMSEKTCLLQHSTGADTNDGLGPSWAIDTSDKPSWTSLSSFDPSMDEFIDTMFATSSGGIKMIRYCCTALGVFSSSV